MSHLSYEQRYSIEVLLKAGKSQTEIGTIISVDKSVISREIKRNRDERNAVYKAILAQNKYDSRLRSKPKRIKLNAEFYSEIKDLIELDYSPEQVSGVLKKIGKTTISHEWIYQLIWKDKHQKGTLYTHLRRKGRRYRKRGSSKDSRGQIVGRVGIEKRPKEADNRSEFGHLEVDTIIGKNHKSAIITLNDMASGMLWMGKVETRDAESVKIKLSQMLEEIRPFIKSVTGDNGKEFSNFKDYEEALGMNNYFANPYHSWERGTNENTNGILRRYFPKGTDFLTLTEIKVEEAVEKINLMPKKCLGWLTPFEVHWGEKLHLT
jgi:IS30 family transposase